ncbi:hypothetical protein NEFER03_0694 [Nematocida sp. LUAm3]|nr:hypothetical protein NEFER03_0694 [Nematocida sp. LUAm3]KAI5175153.1 hypothetical protein NEFER02_1114 [Nematocida sp. LUAm2]KAI5178175.1 hypothetical protein NEFER01_1353 [Nematocida sp. LUAm1]
MKEKKSQRREERKEEKKEAFNNFMTQKEKDFVSFLFEKLAIKKERSSPNFYENESVPHPDTKRKDKEEKEKLFDGVLGSAVRKSVKKTISPEKTEKPFLLKKKIFSQCKIEEIHDLINRDSIFSNDPLSNEQETEQKVILILMEIKEGLFNIEKGIFLIKKLISEKPKIYGRPISEILIDRMKYITATNDFCNFICEMIPILEENQNPLKRSEKELSDSFLTNTTGLLVGHIMLLLYKQEDKEYFVKLSQSISNSLTETKIKRIFHTVAPHLIWHLLTIVTKALSPAQNADLKKRLDKEISSALNNPSPSLSAIVKKFIKAASRNTQHAFR